MPKTLGGHSSLTFGNDLIVLGGESNESNGDNNYSSSVFKLSCKNGIFNWEELDVKLQIPRRSFVASLIPN